MQLIYPRTKMSTLTEIFEFLSCADPDHKIQFNIESKVDAVTPNNTRSVDDFVRIQHAAFKASGYPLKSITVSPNDI